VAQSQVVLIAARFVQGFGGAQIRVLPDFAAAIAAAAPDVGRQHRRVQHRHARRRHRSDASLRAVLARCGNA
jgi:sulfite reductase beta subunit-like hemoprotein